MHISVCASMCRHRSTADLYPCIICRLRTNAVRRPCLCAPTGSGKCTVTRLTHLARNHAMHVVVSLYRVLSHDSKNIHAVQWAHSNARCTLQYNHRCAREQECAGASDARTHHGGGYDGLVLVHGCAECDTTAHIAPLTHHETSRLSIAQCSLSLRRCPSLAVRRPRLSVRVH